MPYPPFPDTPDRKPPERFAVSRIAGINRQPGVSRSSLRDDEVYWLENIMPVGPGNLRGMYYEQFNQYYTVPGSKRIINVFGFVRNGVQLQAVFLDDGTAQQVNPANGQVTNLVTLPGLLYDGSWPPQAAQWNSNGIVIVGKGIFTGTGLWAWDGSVFQSAGGMAPAWLTGGVGGVTMPIGVYGNAVEVYQNRLWISTPPAPGGIGAILTVSAPNNGADFNTADGSTITPIQDSSTRTLINALRQSNGFLYAVGDSNCTAISNVQTGGAPTITTFLQQNLDPQTGTAWQATAQLYGNALIYANTAGVFALSGGVVQKLSQDIDQLFLAADFTVAPTAAVVYIFGVKCYCILLRTVDYLNVTRNIICCWNGRRWFLASTNNSNVDQIYGFGEEYNSALPGYCSDGSHLYQMFVRPAANTNKIVQSKFFAGGDNDAEWIAYKKQYRFYFKAQDYAGVGVNLTGTMDTDGTAAPPLSLTTPGAFYEFQNSSQQTIHLQSSLGTILWGVAGVGITGTDTTNYGRLLGCTFEVIAADFSLSSMVMEYSYDAPFLG